MKIPKIKKSYLIIIMILVFGGSYYWYKKANSTTSTVKYVTSTAEKGTLTTSISGSGNVIVDQSSNIDPTITGTVTNLAVAVGDKVKKGQLLFNIVNDDLSVSVAKSLSSYKQALSSLESAKANKKQAKYDYQTSAISKQKPALKQKVESAEASVASAEQGLISAQADLTNQRSNAAERKVVSPIDGTVNAVNIKNGDDLSKLSSGSSRQVPIIIGDLGTLKAQVQINEVDISNVSIGQKATLTFNAIDELTATGQVEKMDSLGTLSSGVVTFNVTISFDTLDPKIKPEMSVSAAIITETKQNTLIVPNSAIKTENGSSYVEIMRNGQTVPIKTPVKTGISNNTDTEIASGINAGDKIVTQTINSASGSTSAAKTTSGSNSRGGGSFGPFGH